MSTQLCEHTIIDRDGHEQPCDQPATGWRWYQDCAHEDMLAPACDVHANEGGRRIAQAEAAVDRMTNLASDESERRVKAEAKVRRVEALRLNYAGRAEYAPRPLAQWADIEADLRDALSWATP